MNFIKGYQKEVSSSPRSFAENRASDLNLSTNNNYPMKSSSLLQVGFVPRFYRFKFGALKVTSFTHI